MRGRREKKEKEEERGVKESQFSEKKKSLLGHKQICLCRAQQATRTRVSSHAAHVRQSREKKKKQE